MVTATPGERKGKRVFFAILALMTFLEAGTFVIELLSGALSYPVLLRPLFCAALLFGMWRGKQLARTLLAFFAFLATLFMGYLVVKYQSPILFVLLFVFGSLFSLLVFVPPLTQFMDLQRKSATNRKGSKDVTL